MFRKPIRNQIKAKKFEKSRKSFIFELMSLFKNCNSKIDKEELLAHLGNLCYDPINFEIIKETGVLQFLIDQIGIDETLTEFSLSGIANLSVEIEFLDQIYKNFDFIFNRPLQLKVKGIGIAQSIFLIVWHLQESEYAFNNLQKNTIDLWADSMKGKDSVIDNLLNLISGNKLERIESPS